MPRLLPFPLKSFIPSTLLSQHFRQFPSQRFAPNPHPHQMSLLPLLNLERISAVQDREVIHEVHVALLQRNRDAVLLR